VRKLFLLFTVIFVASSFTQVNMTALYPDIPNLKFTANAWGDYDNDGDLDLAVTGSPDPSTGTYCASVFRNDGSGTFTDINAGLTGVFGGKTEWGDCDSDGDLDLLLSGNVTSNPQLGETSMKAILYRNNGNGTFTNILTLDDYGYATFGDYDDDGDQDILARGSAYMLVVKQIVYSASIFKNVGNGSFVWQNISLPLGSKLDWFDYNSDGKCDIISSGDSTRVLNNLGNGIFNDSGLSIPFNSSSDYEAGDFDSDGDFDLIFVQDGLSRLYRNDGDSVYVEIDAGLENMSEMCKVSSGDINVDGKLDIILSGYSTENSGWRTKIYLNAGNNQFNPVNTQDPFLNLGAYETLIGDFDNDRDLDVLCSGSKYGNMTRLMRNNSAKKNTVPLKPLNLSVSREKNNYIFAWDKAIDGETDQNGLSYNIYLSTSPNSCNITSPASNLSTGYRKVVKSGNSGSNNFYSISDLVCGTYYWSVQAVDNCFAGSLFFQEQSFTIPVVPVNVVISNEENEINISWSAVPGATWYKVYSCEEPYGTFGDVSSEGTFTGTTWTGTGFTGNKLFYYVVAVSE